MTEHKSTLERYLDSGAVEPKTHLHPRLSERLGFDADAPHFVRAEGSSLYTAGGDRYVDFVAGNGVHWLGRNQPEMRRALREVAEMDLPNLCIVNASILGGLVAEKLLGLAGGTMGKIIYANSGTEATDVVIRFARFVTRKRRFLFHEGAFHGRSFGAVSVAGFPELKEGMDPLLPTVTMIRPNDLAQLRKELKQGDVAGVLFEPVQRVTGRVIDRGYLREAEILCKQHGAILIADETETGLGRTGHWFATTGTGLRPDMMTIAGALSGGEVPVSAVLMTNEVYENVYAKLTSGPIYFSTFAENNLAMTSALVTMESLEAIDAPALAAASGALLRERLESVRQDHPTVERIDGKGLLVLVHFQVEDAADPTGVARDVAARLFRDHHYLTQLPGVGVNAIKLLPPVTTSEEDLLGFADALDAVLTARSAS